jgi:hypothetical protein
MFGTVFSMGSSSAAGSSVGVSEATEEKAAVTSTAKDGLKAGRRSLKFGFIRNLPFIANIRQKDAVGGGTVGSNEAPHDPVEVPLSKGTTRFGLRDSMGESGPLTAPSSRASNESDIDSSAAAFDDILWRGSPGTRNERRGNSNEGNQKPNSDNLVIPCEEFLSKHIRGRENSDDETLASRRSRETQSSRRSSRPLTGKIPLTRRSLNRRREEDAFSDNHVAPTSGSRSTTENENDRDVRSSSLERQEPSTRRIPESPRKMSEKPTGSPSLKGEKPPESPRKKTTSLRVFNVGSPRKTPTSPRKKIAGLPPPPPESPGKRGEKPSDSPRLEGEKPSESPRKKTDTSRKLNMDSPRKPPTSPRKKIIETPRKTSSIPSSPKNRASDSPRKSASECLTKTSSFSQLMGKENTKKTSPSREKPESPQKLSFSSRKSTSRLTFADQNLLDDLTRKMMIANMDETKAPGYFKASETNEFIKKHIQEVAAIAESRPKESTSSTATASPNGSSSPKEPKSRTEESISWGEVVRLVGCKNLVG